MKTEDLPTTSQSPPARALGLKWAAPLFALAAILFFVHALVRPETTFLGWDMSQGNLPWMRHAFPELRAGTVTHWLPFFIGGVPYMADPQNGLLYPLNIIFIFLPVHLGINYNILLHVFLAGLFTFMLARELGLGRAGSMVAGLVGMFNGTVMGKILLGSLAPLDTAAWLPLLMYLTLRLEKSPGLRAAAWLGLAAAMNLLAGHPQFVYYNLLGLSVFAVWRLVLAWRRSGGAWASAGLLGWLVGAGVLGFLLTAFQLLPMFEALTVSDRGAGVPYYELAASSLPPAALVTAVAPGFFGDMVATRYWGELFQTMQSFYVGLLPLFLAGFGLLRWRHRGQALFWAGFSLLFLVLAMGRFTPAFGFLHPVVSGLGSFRMASRVLYLFALGVALLAGMGFKPFMDWLRSPRLGVRSLVAVGAAALGFTALYAATALMPASLWERIVAGMARICLQPNPVDLGDAAELARLQAAAAAATAGAGALFAVLAALAAAVRIGSARSRRFAGWAPVLLIGFILADLYIYGARYIIPYDHTENDFPIELVEAIRADAGDELFRVFTLLPAAAMSLPGPLGPFFGGVTEYSPGAYHWGMLYGLDNAGGRAALSDGRYRRLTTDNSTFEHRRIGVPALKTLLNVRYVIAAGPELMAQVSPEAAHLYGLLDEPMEKVFESGKFVVYRRERVMPRFWLSEQGALVADPLERVRLLRLGRAPDRMAPMGRFAELEIDSGLVTDPAPALPVRVIEYSPHKVVIEVAAERESILAGTEVWYPSWRAWIDGEPVPVLRINHAFRGVRVGPGRHTVVMRFEPTAFRRGGLISLAALTLVVGILVAGRRRPRDSETGFEF